MYPVTDPHMTMIVVDFDAYAGIRVWTYYGPEIEISGKTLDSLHYLWEIGYHMTT